MTEYAFHPEAETDLNQIWDYLADDNVSIADRVIADIHGALENVMHFPHSGHRRTDLTSLPVRFIRVRDYLIAYAPEEEPAWVIAVMHGHRSPQAMAAILRARQDRSPGT